MVPVRDFHIRNQLVPIHDLRDTFNTRLAEAGVTGIVRMSQSLWILEPLSEFS
jgi:integrase